MALIVDDEHVSGNIVNVVNYFESEIIKQLERVNDSNMEDTCQNVIMVVELLSTIINNLYTGAINKTSNITVEYNPMGCYVVKELK